MSPSALRSPDADATRPEATGAGALRTSRTLGFGLKSLARDGRLLVAAGLAVALYCAARLWTSLAPYVTAVAVPSDPLWIRDFVQDYLLARATLDRRDPYELISTLARDYLPVAVDRALPNPTPHPPTLISFVWPLGLVSYEVAAVVWLGIQLIALAIVSAILAGHVFSPLSHWERGVGRVRSVLAVALLLHAWSPVAADLLQGQLMLVTAALLLLGWQAFRNGRPVAAGLAFGIATSIKLLPGVLLLFFIARREYRVVLAAALVGVVALAAPLLWLGPGIVERYLTYALPTTSDFWLGCRGNYSVFGVAARFFGESNEVLPVIEAGWLVSPVGIAASLTLVVTAFSWATCRLDPEVEIAIFVVVMLLVFPIAWSHYLVLLAWPLAVVARRIRARGLARRDALLLLAIAPHAVLLPGDLIALGERLFGPTTAIDRLPFTATLPGLIPTVGLLALIWLLWRERATSRPRETSGRTPAPDRL